MSGYKAKLASLPNGPSLPFEPPSPTTSTPRLRTGSAAVCNRWHGLSASWKRLHADARASGCRARSGLCTIFYLPFVKPTGVVGIFPADQGHIALRIGRPLFALAASALDEIEMVSLAMPVLEDLSRETGEGGHFAVRMGDFVVVIARTAAPGAFQLAERVGVVRPAHCTALGKVILAALRDDQLDRFLARVELTPVTPRSITEPRALKKDIDGVRRSGIAFDDGEFNPEVRCVGVPVKDFTGQVIGAIGISGPIWRLSI